MGFHIVLRRLLPSLFFLGALTPVLAGCPVSAGDSGHPVISEVMWAGSDLSTADEWLEVACIGQGTCDLSGWSITGLRSTGEEVVIVSFPAGSIFGSGEARVISRYPVASSRLAIEPWIVTTSLSLPNTKLHLTLLDQSGAILDDVDDGVGNPWAGNNPSGGPKASMERIDFMAPGSDAGNWRTAAESSGFTSGVEIYGTPGTVQESSQSCSSSSSEDSSSVSSESSASLESSSSDRTREGVLLASTSSDSSVSSYSLSSLSSSDRTREGVLLASTSSDSSVSSLSSLSSFSSNSLASQTSLSVLITEVLANPIGSDAEEWIELGNPGSVPVNIAGFVLRVGTSTAYVIPPQSDDAFLLHPGGAVAFRKSQTGLPLTNAGNIVRLWSGALLVDTLAYPETAEEVSFGRDPTAPDRLMPFCVPTPGKSNTVEPFAPRIVIQSAGEAAIGANIVMGTERVTINLQAAAGAGSLASAACAWDYDDDAVNQACNPPSHTFADPGEYAVRLTVRDFCGGIGVATLAVSVQPEPEEVSAASSPASSSRSSASSSSATSQPSPIQTPLNGVSSPTSSSRPPQLGVILNEVQSLGDEWIELFNPTDQEIALSGWILDDLKSGGLALRSSARSGGGSKSYSIPSDTHIGAGEYLLFSKRITKLALNDSGDDVWLIAPDDSWSQRTTVPKLKKGTSFSFCDGAWRIAVPSPGAANACGAAASAQMPSASPKSRTAQAAPAIFTRTRYIAAFLSSNSSISSISSYSSDSIVMTYAANELPSLLTVAGGPEGEHRFAGGLERSYIPEASVIGSMGTIGMILLWLKRRLLP